MQTAPALHRAVALAPGLSSTMPSHDHNRGRGGGCCGRNRHRGRGLRHRITGVGMHLPTSKAGDGRICRRPFCLEAHDRIGCRTAP
jgi:hypothetical protein